MEIRKIMMCSTGHIPGHIAKRFNNDTYCPEGVVIENVEYGWFVRYWNTRDEPRSHWPHQLRLVVEAAESNECSMILFDCDADELDGIRTYEW